MGDSFEEMFGEIVGYGSQATVYAKGESAVKLYREGYPKRNVFSEAYIMGELETMNFPSPKIYEVLLVNGRYGLRMERVWGKNIGEAGMDLAQIESVLDVIVDLQCRLHKYENTGWAPNLKQRLHDDLDRNTRLCVDLKKKLLGLLEGLPDGVALCHCDFHAGNVFSCGDKYMIVDVLQISRGDPTGDVVCSYVSYYLYNQELGEEYLKRYCKKARISREKVLQWLPVYAGTLLGQMPEQYTPTIERLIAGNEAIR